VHAAKGTVELLRAPGNKLQRLDIAGRPGDDTFNLADLDANFAGLVSGDAGAGNDTLRLTGSGQELDQEGQVLSTRPRPLQV